MAHQGLVRRYGAPKLNFVAFPGARSQITITMVSIHLFKGRRKRKTRGVGKEANVL